MANEISPLNWNGLFQDTRPTLKAARERFIENAAQAVNRRRDVSMLTFVEAFENTMREMELTRE